MKRQLLLLELNEVNFEYVAWYCKRGHFPHFATLLKTHKVAETSSERNYEHLEPWIQWVTAHTGQPLADHGVFRLGDIVQKDLPQIWEELEVEGYSVGAMSPMNAKHRLKRPAFFVPDPWTNTTITARPVLAAMFKAIAQAVNDNAQSRITAASAARLILGLLAYARPKHYGDYLSYALSARACPWRKAMFLDLLFADVFVREVVRTEVHFASLFLNAAAHIQHHYMFSAAAYDGAQRNPGWYLKPGYDPVREVYALYDRIVGSVLQRMPLARVMIATGLHQDPYGRVTYYWRLKRHDDFLRKIGVTFAKVEPRMSRDFLIVCSDSVQAQQAADRLTLARTREGIPLFEVDLRGNDVFAMLTFSDEIDAAFQFRVGDQIFDGFLGDVAFVALKNGQHNETGYFLDTGAKPGEPPDRFPLAELPNRVKSAMAVVGREPRAAA